MSIPPEQPPTFPLQQGQPYYAPQPVQPRQRSPWLWVGLGCGVLVLVSACCFGLSTLGVFAAVLGRATATPFVVSGKPGATSAASGASSGLNQTASIKNWDVTVTGVEHPGKDLVWSQFGNKSTAVGTWVVVVVKMKNTGNQNFGVNTFDFELRAAGGVKYNVSTDAFSYSAYKGGQSLGGQVPPGSEVTYYVPFDVTLTASGLQFVFKQDKNPIFTIGNAAP